MSTSSTDTVAHPLSCAIDIVGLQKLATALGVSYQAVLKWKKAGRLPRTEWTGETAYAQTIEMLTEGRVSRSRLLAPWPAPVEPSQRGVAA